MAIDVSYYDLVTVQSEYITVDLIVWRRYRVKAIGVVERLLDDNPHLAKLHRTSPFLPVGTQVRIPMDVGILAGAPRAKETILLWGSLRPGQFQEGELGQSRILSQEEQRAVNVIEP